MQIQVRYYAEITIKSRPVRKRLCRRLAANLRRQLARLVAGVQVRQGWDQILIELPPVSESQLEAIYDSLERSCGVAWFSPVETLPLTTIEDLVTAATSRWRERATGQSIAVRCRRRGNHAFPLARGGTRTWGSPAQRRGRITR